MLIICIHVTVQYFNLAFVRQQFDNTNKAQFLVRVKLFYNCNDHLEFSFLSRMGFVSFSSQSGSMMSSY